MANEYCPLSSTMARHRTILHDVVAGRSQVPHEAAERHVKSLSVPGPEASLVSEPQDKRQGSTEPSHVLVAETPDFLSLVFPRCLRHPE